MLIVAVVVEPEAYDNDSINNDKKLNTRDG
jgi:hypothetical protein